MVPGYRTARLTRLRRTPPPSSTPVVPPPRPSLKPPAPAAAQPRVPWAEDANPLAKIGFGFLLLFIFLSTSRVLDYSLYYLRIPLITSILAGALIFASGGLRTAFETRIAKFMGLFAVWFVVCMPFSQWR